MVRRSGSDSQTANQLVPESNQTSRMSVSLRKVVPPQCAHVVPAGSRSAMGVVCQASTPSRSKRSTILRFESGVDDGLVAAFAQEDGDGHAPDALAADAPVGAGGDHVGDAFFAPGRVPDDLVDFFDGELAEGGFGTVGALHWSFKADEPLLGGAEDDGMVAAPAMRIGVLEVGDGQQCARSPRAWRR